MSDKISIQETLQKPRASGQTSQFAATRLSWGIIWHPDTTRIGEVAAAGFDTQKRTHISRLSPIFSTPGRYLERPLDSAYISRTPVEILKVSDRQFEFRNPASRMPVTVNGTPLDGRLRVSMDELGHDIIVEIARSVVLSLFYMQADTISGDDDFGLLGISPSMAQTRSAIRRVAGTDINVLIRGETGTGKELVAHGIHKIGARSGALHSVNMAAISPDLAAAELFGVKKGAFTGAVVDRPGLFSRADGETLFMDEIGDVPADVQPMLLRALDLGEIRPVGGTNANTVDVRIVAATDSMLEQSDGQNSFNQPLFRRLENYTITIAPLRDRRVDVGLLLRAFSEAFKARHSAVEIQPFETGQITEMALYHWPGNVRELRNVVEQLLLGQPSPARLSSGSDDTAGASRRAGGSKTYVDTSAVSDDMLVAALDESNWVIKDAANQLGVSRTSFYKLLKNSVQVRAIDDISDAEIRSVQSQTHGGLVAWSRALRTPQVGLKRRLKSLG